MLRASRDGSYHSELAETHVQDGHTSDSHRTHERHNRAVVYPVRMALLLTQASDTPLSNPDIKKWAREARQFGRVFAKSAQCFGLKRMLLGFMDQDRSCVASIASPAKSLATNSFSKPPRTFASMYPDSITLKTQRAPFSWYLASNRTASGFEGLAPNGRRDTTSTSSVALSTRADRVQSGRGL